MSPFTRINRLNSLRPSQRLALEKRIEVSIQVAISGKTDSPQCTIAGKHSTSEKVLKFLALLGTSNLSSKEQLGFSFLTLFGEYPSQNTIQGALSHFQAGQPEKAVEDWLSDSFLRSLIEFKLTRELIPCNPACLYVDVSHTVDYPFTSGIQRVVRRTAAEFALQGKNVQYFKYSSSTHGPQVLTPEELGRLISCQGLEREHSAGMLKQTTPCRFLHGLLPQRAAWVASRLLKLPIRILKYFTSDLHLLSTRNLHRFRYEFLDPISRRFEIAKSVIRQVDRLEGTLLSGSMAIRNLLGSVHRRFFKSHQKILFFSDANILLPELTTEERRPQFYIDLKAFPRNTINILVYDLIPLLSPENCIEKDVSNFAHYLRAFQVADRLIGISRSVEENIRTFTQLLPRKSDPSLQISHIWLAGNFLKSDTTQPTILTPSISKMILCVGTLEKRKNQLSILKAASSLRRKGYQFQIHFVGNKGWGGEALLRASRAIDPQQQFIKIHHNLQDKTLLHLYQSSYFTMFCSYIEGFGLPILESLKLKRPVITSNRGSMREIAERVGGCDLIDPEDLQSIENAMERFLSDEQYYQAKTAEIQEVPNISWDHFARLLFEKCSESVN